MAGSLWTFARGGDVEGLEIIFIYMRERYQFFTVFEIRTNAGRWAMAPDLIICTSTEAERSGDRAAEDLATRMTPNTSFSCTPHSSTAAAEPSAMFSNPWSSHNSPIATPRSSCLGQNSSILIPNSAKPNAVPIITLKTREALRNLSCRDQESMEEEILQLKRALLEKDMELRRRKVHAANVEAENRYGQCKGWRIW